MLDGKIGIPVSYLGKVGIISDLLSSSKGGTDYVVFKSAESIVRSLGATDSEVIPLAQDVIKKITTEEFIADVDEKTKYVQTKLMDRKNNGMEELSTSPVCAIFSVPYIVVCDTDDALVIKDIFGTVSIALHRGKFREIDNESAVILARKHYGNIIGKILGTLDEFKNSVVNKQSGADINK